MSCIQTRTGGCSPPAQNAEHACAVGRISEPGAAVAGRSRQAASSQATATARRSRPSRSFRSTCVPRFSTAIMTGTFSVEAPCLPVARPPMNASSTSTTLVSNTVRAHHRAQLWCSDAQAARYDRRCRACRAGFLRRRCSSARSTNQTVANDVLNGVRVRRKERRRCHRGLAPTAGTLPMPRRGLPRLITTTHRAPKTLRPAQTR